MKNRIGGEVERLTRDAFMNLVTLENQDQLIRMLARTDVEGAVAYRVEQMDSSAFGMSQFMIYGPGCTYKTVEEANGRLGDVPSRFAYPFAYWSKS